jgi:quercetin dioxygenase-like cupin family protein
MRIQRWDTVPAEEVAAKISRRMIVGTNEMLVRWEFKKGGIAARHSHVHEQIVLMIHGKIRLVVGDTEMILQDDDIVVIPPNTPHEAIALEDTIVIDIFSPPRQDFLDGDRPAYLR